MFQKLLTNLLLDALCSVLCQILGICCDDENCPDGVCEPVISELEDLRTGGVSYHPAQTASVNFNWDALPQFIDAVKSLVAAIRGLLGKDQKLVG